MSVKRSTVSIGLVGDPQVGKTSLATMLCFGTVPSEYEPTIDDLYTSIVSGTTVEVLDTSSSQSEPEKTMRKLAIKQCDCILMVYNTYNPNSAEQLILHLEEIRSIFDWVEIPQLPLVLCVAGVQTDAKLNGECALQIGKDFAETWGLEHISIPLERPLVREAFTFCVKMIEYKQKHLYQMVSSKAQSCCILL